MFAKFPEVLHHDTKGRVCKWGMPWWFSIGINGARGNFIALRGWIHNESRAMFRFCEKALIQIHGTSMQNLICHCSDGIDDFIAVLMSITHHEPCRRLLAQGHLHPMHVAHHRPGYFTRVSHVSRTMDQRAYTHFVEALLLYGDASRIPSGMELVDFHMATPYPG
jgi:hypothetical protein